jgi:hypothetical protein
LSSAKLANGKGGNGKHLLDKARALVKQHAK